MMGPDFSEAQSPNLPSTWVNATPPQSAEGDLATWWKQFRDPQLEKILSTGFSSNPDMISAALSIGQAESALRSTQSGMLPSMGGNLGSSNSGNYDTSNSHGNFNGGLSASWTPDIWGATRREIEANFAALGSSNAAAAATRTALSVSISSAYFQWIEAKENLRIAREQLNYQEHTYRIVRDLVNEGFKSELDLQEAIVTISSTRSSIPAFEANIRAYENNLAALLGTTVNNLKLKMPAASVYNLTPRIPINLPSDLLRRRPDIVRAEYELAGQSALEGVAIARLFPDISLTGSTGSSAGTDFARFWKSSTWGLSASVSETIFNRSALNENVAQAELATLKSAQSYRKTVIEAFAEVERELISYAQLTSQLPEYQRARDASKSASELSLRRYNEGLTDFLNVSSAQRSWLSSELKLISTKQTIRLALARLCAAMGGGYETNLTQF